MAKTTFVLEGKEANAVNAFLKVVDAQNKTVDGMRKVTREGNKASTAMSGVARQVTGFLASFAGLAGITMAFRELVQELERIIALKKEMADTAMTTEQLAMKIAHLRGEVTTGGIKQVTADVADIAKQTSVSLESAATTLFYAESAMGAKTPRARAAALAISQFAGPAGLTPEETKLIPKLFDVMQANTRDRQMEILNQLKTATAASIAETGEFIAPFMKPLVADVQRGFSLPQSLARMVAAVQVTGSVEEAGTISTTALDIAAGRTKKALDFYGLMARRRGIDYAELTDPERYEFARRLYKEAMEGEDQRQMDLLKTMVGAKGFRALRALFGEAGERKYFEVLPIVEQAVTSTAVQDMAGQYQQLLTAERTRQARMRQMGQYGVGMATRPMTLLEEMTTDVLGIAKGRAEGFGDTLAWWMTPGEMERHIAAKTIMAANLAAMKRQTVQGTERYRQLEDLQERLQYTRIFRWDEPFVRDIYEATEGFRAAERYPGGGRGGGRYWEAVRQYFGQGAAGGADNTAAIKENTEALQRLTEKIPAGISSTPLGRDE